MILLFLIIAISLLFWIAFFYRHSMRSSTQRSYTVQKVGELLPFIPLGLQGIYLFCFGLAHLIPVSCSLQHLIAGELPWNSKFLFQELEPLLIILTGFLLLGSQYALFKFFQARILSSPALSKWGGFIIGFFMLRYLTLQIQLNLSSNQLDAEPASAVPGLLIAVLLIGSVGISLMPDSENASSLIRIFKKYLYLTYRWMALYVFFVVLLLLPQLLHRLIVFGIT